MRAWRKRVPVTTSCLGFLAGLVMVACLWTGARSNSPRAFFFGMRSRSSGAIWPMQRFRRPVCLQLLSCQVDSQPMSSLLPGSFPHLCGWNDRYKAVSPVIWAGSVDNHQPAAFSDTSPSVPSLPQRFHHPWFPVAKAISPVARILNVSQRFRYHMSSPDPSSPLLVLVNPRGPREGRERVHGTWGPGGTCYASRTFINFYEYF